MLELKTIVSFGTVGLAAIAGVVANAGCANNTGLPYSGFVGGTVDGGAGSDDGPASNVSSSGSAGSSGYGSSDGTDGGSSSGSGGSLSANSAGGSNTGSSGGPITSSNSSGSSSSNSSGSSSGNGSSSSSGSGSGGSAGTVGGVPGGQASGGATISGCQIFPSDNPWNVAVDGPSVQVIHTYDSKLVQGTALHADWGDYSTNGYGIPYNVVPASQATQTTIFSVSANESDPGPGGWTGANPNTSGSSTGTTAYPFFSGMKVEGNPAPGGTPGNLPGDQHALVLEQGASGCKLYEAWSCAVSASAPFRCANGAIFDLASNATRTLGWTSGDAAGLPILPGLVRLSEVQAGAIRHAIRFTLNVTQGAYILPATHAAGSSGSTLPPMGLRLRLKASVSTSSYSAASQVIMTALKKYGLILADNGSDWYVQGDSDDGWNATAPDGRDTLIGEISSDFHNLTGADFEAIYSGDPITTGL